MRYPENTVLVLLAALLLPGAALAQEGTGGQPQAQSQETGSGPQADTAQDARPADPDEAGRDPERYEASESISEDQPVSFPVDI